MDLCPEVALGAAEAEDRAALLAHVERCAGCAAALRSMTEVADGLVALVPTIEPPDGFAERVLGTVRHATGRSSRTTLLRRAAARPVAVAAAVAAAAALSVGGWLVGEATAGSSSPVARAALESHGTHVGEVVLVQGAHPWISMTVQGGPVGAVVRCEVRDGRGSMVALGTFTLNEGYGSWAAPLPGGMTVRGAELVTPMGRVVALASFSTG